MKFIKNEARIQGYYNEYDIPIMKLTYIPVTTALRDQLKVNKGQGRSYSYFISELLESKIPK